jgi:splicing factor 3B subunit 1
VATLGVADVDERLEERLVDGILNAFQDQSVDDPIILNAFGTICNSLGQRCKPYLPQIVTTILYRLNSKTPAVRQQAADLISRIANIISTCGEETMLTKLGSVLYE